MEQLLAQAQMEDYSIIIVIVCVCMFPCNLCESDSTASLAHLFEPAAFVKKVLIIISKMCKMKIFNSCWFNTISILCDASIPLPLSPCIYWATGQSKKYKTYNHYATFRQCQNKWFACTIYLSDVFKRMNYSYFKHFAEILISFLWLGESAPMMHSY